MENSLNPNRVKHADVNVYRQDLHIPSFMITMEYFALKN